MKSYELLSIDKITRSFFVYCFTCERVERDGNERIALKVETKRNETKRTLYRYLLCLWHWSSSSRWPSLFFKSTRISRFPVNIRQICIVNVRLTSIKSRTCGNSQRSIGSKFSTVNAQHRIFPILCFSGFQLNHRENLRRKNCQSTERYGTD